MAEITKDELDEAADGQTVPMRFLRTVAAHPDQVALRAKDGDGWVEVTYREYADRVAVVTTALEGLGVGPGDRVVLMMRNIIDFHIIDLALLFRGATPISIYNSSAPEQIAYLAGHCKATMAIVEDIGFLERVLKVRDELPALATIVVLSDPDGLAGDDVVQRADAVRGPRAGRPRGGHRRTARPSRWSRSSTPRAPPGPPKGVMLTHRNIVWTAEGYLAPPRRGARRVPRRVVPPDGPHRRAHVHPLPRGHRRLRGHRPAPTPAQIAAYAREVHPQIMFGVPRGVGEDPRRRAGRARRRPREEGQVRRAPSPPPAPIVERRTAGTATDEDLATWAVPRRGRLRRRAGARRPRRRRVRAHRRRAHPAPSSSAGTAPSACRCRRSTACPRAAAR